MPSSATSIREFTFGRRKRGACHSFGCTRVHV
jgi:hypothetical protein